MSAMTSQPQDPLTAQMAEVAEQLSDILAPGHALPPNIQRELELAVDELLAQTDVEMERVKGFDTARALREKQVLLRQLEDMKRRVLRAIKERFEELVQQYLAARAAFHQAIDRRALSPEVKAASKAVFPSMPNDRQVTNSFILAHLEDTQRKGQAILRVLLVAETVE